MKADDGSDATLIADLARAGLDPLLLQRVALAIAHATTAAGAIEKRRGADRERQARHRCRVMSRDVTLDNVSHVTPSLKKQRSPDPYKNPTLSPYPSDPNGSSGSLAPEPDRPPPVVQLPLPMVVVEPEKPPKPKKPRKHDDWPEDPAEGFKTFWLGYPRHIGKKEAFVAFQVVYRSDEVGYNVILEREKRYATEVEGEEERFIMHPKTWLRNARWNDAPKKEPNYVKPSCPEDYLTTPPERFKSPGDQRTAAVAQAAAEYYSEQRERESGGRWWEGR